MDQFPFKLATAARACSFRVDRKNWTIDKLPIRGATAALEVNDNGSRHTASRVAAGVAAGAVFLPLALVGLTKKSGVTIQVTITTPAGKATKLVPGSRHQMALDFVNQFNALTQVPAA